MNKTKKIRIAIILELKKREMPFMSILQDLLLKKGYDVKLIPFRSLVTYHLLSYKPDIVMINGLRTADPCLISQIYIPKKMFNARIMCYYSEQVGYYEKSLAYQYSDQLIMHNIDYHIAWGPRFAEDLIKLGAPKEKVWYIGSLQYDIDKYIKSSVLDVKAELAENYNLNAKNKWVLYTDNIIKKFQKPELYDIRRKETFDLIKNAACEIPNATFIFRPHPETPQHEINYAKVYFKNEPNVKIISDGHVFNWTYVCDSLIMWCSTSSIQAMFLNKFVIGFVTSDGQELEKYWYKEVFPSFDNIPELVNCLKNCLEGEKTEKEFGFEKKQQEYIREWYFENDKLCFERLIYLFELVASDTPVPYIGKKYPLTHICGILAKELKSKIGDFVKGRTKDRTIYSKDIYNELRKYDTNKFEKVNFKVCQTNRGVFLKKCQHH